MWGMLHYLFQKQEQVIHLKIGALFRRWEVPTLMPGKQIPLASAAYVYSLTGKITSMK